MVLRDNRVGGQSHGTGVIKKRKGSQEWRKNPTIVNGANANSVCEPMHLISTGWQHPTRSPKPKYQEQQGSPTERHYNYKGAT